MKNLKSDIFIDFDPFSGDFSKLQQIPRNSVGLPYGFLSVVFRVVTVGESVISLFWWYLDSCAFLMLFRVFDRFRVFFQ